jgi:N-acetyl sugar amidotransferase
MKYCNICLENNLRPNVIFNKGLCPSCYYIKRNENEIFWNKRLELLKEITQKYKNPNNKFDCIIGVSGGKDSIRQALWVRDKLKMNPLLVSLCYPPQQVTDIGTENISNLINLGFDVIISSLAPKTWKNLMRESFLKFANWAKSTELALFSSVPQAAIRFNIPLIFWGENVGLQVGDMASNSKKEYDGNNLRKLNTLNSGDLSWIKSKKFKTLDLIPYKYPSEDEFKKNKIQIIYLGWFFKDWSMLNNAKTSIIEGLYIRDKKFKNYGDLFRTSSLDEDWVTFNQLIKYYKFGFGRATEYLNEEIRTGNISRKDAAKIAQKYDGKYSNRIIKEFCDFIEISSTLFWSTVKKNTNKKLFEIKGKKIKPKFTVGINFD